MEANTQQSHVEIFKGRKYSSLKKLLGVTKQVFRYINICKKEEFVQEFPLDYWLKLVQETEYVEESRFLREKIGKAPELVKK